MGEVSGFKVFFGKLTGKHVTTSSEQLDGSNSDKKIKDYNCYEFASGIVKFDGKFADVGFQGGKPYLPVPNWIYTFDESLKADGFIKATKADIDKYGQPKDKEGFNVVAAYHTTEKSERVGYHFTRKDNQGHWQHKLGSPGVSYLDSDNKPITDAKNANFDYTTPEGVKVLDYDFRGYFYVPKAGVQTTCEVDLGNLKPPTAHQKMKPDEILGKLNQYTKVETRDEFQR